MLAQAAVYVAGFVNLARMADMVGLVWVYEVAWRFRAGFFPAAPVVCCVVRATTQPSIADGRANFFSSPVTGEGKTMDHRQTTCCAKDRRLFPNSLTDMRHPPA